MELRFEQARYEREGTCLLGPIDLCWRANGITAIIGPNGAGKSLFLELAHGLCTPSHGRVNWDDHPASATKRNRGFVFQNRMILNRSVADNTALALMVAGLDRANIRARVIEALTQVDLASQADQPAATLSGGEMQRLALARALIHNPAVLLLDEPTSQLDPTSLRLFEQRVIHVAQSGTPILWVTHNLRQAQTYADHIILLCSGAVIEHSTAKDFFETPKTQTGQAFLTDAQ